jgi:HD-GYP domain-containing protein (c-di-GMP phosphodiesterase class II)
MCLVEKSNPRLKDMLEFSQKDICSFLMSKLRFHHQDTYMHSLRVSALCAELFGLFGIEKEVQETILRSVLLHDVGKIRIDSNLLDKQGPLNKEEWKILKHHCRNGADILDTKMMKDCIDLDVILYHHENLDGTGYYGLKNNELSMVVKIIRAADSFDAMTQPRAYNQTKSTFEAFEELYRLSGRHYDPQVVNALYSLKNPK